MKRVSLAAIVLALTTALAQAQGPSVPQLINYQGKLSDINGVPLPTGSYVLEFNIYDAKTGGNILWGPVIFDNGSGTGHGAKIPVVNGFFNVFLGPVDIHDHSVSVAFAIAKTYLGIKVTSGTWAPDLRELSPRQQILSSPYALQSGDADTLGRGKVAVGAGAAAGQVVVNAKTSIGSGYTATAAPANGLIVEGPVGIGTSNLGGAKARISGGVLNVDSQLGAQSATIGSGYYLTYGPPSNGLIVQGNVGVGVSVPSEKLEVNGRIKDQWGYVMPVGAVLPYAGTGVPSGWLLCDGSPVSRSTYATLFGVIGVQYGAGNGSTTFNLPDLRGRVVVGYNGSDGDFNAVGKVGGEKAHVLSYNEMPRHKHSAGDIYPNDDNSWIGSDPYGWGDIRVGDGDGTYQCQRWYDTSLEGWNYAHNNLQPYITLLYIIKY